MTDQDIHPDTGADEDARIWAELEAQDEAAAAAASASAEPEPEPAPDADQTPAEDDQPAEPSEPPAEPAGTAEPAAPAAPDIWANATPEQRAALEELRKQHEATLEQLNKTNDLYRRVSGTVSALQKKLNRYEGRQAPAAAAAGKPGDKAQDDAAKKPSSILDDPELAKVEAEYPEVIGPLKKGFKTLEERTEAMAAKLEAMDAKEFEAHLVEQSQFVASQHPDYETLIRTPEFKRWRAEAPQFIQDAIIRNAKEIVDGHEVASVVEVFKLQTGWGRQATQQPAAEAPGNPQPTAQPDPKRKAQLESAAAPRGRGPSPKNGQPESDEDWWNYWDEQERRAAKR